MRFKYFASVILLLLYGCSKQDVEKSESTKKDSISLYLKRADDRNLNSHIRRSSVDRAIFLLKRKENVESNYIFNAASIFYQLGEEQAFRNTMNYYFENAEARRDSVGLGKGYNFLGNYYIEKGLNDSAFICVLKAEKIFKQIGDTVNLGDNYVDKAFIQLYENDYAGCERSAFQALPFIKIAKKKRKEYEIYNLVGISSNELKDFKNAIIYHERALQLAVDANFDSNLHFEASSLNNIGVVYQNLEDHSDAIRTFQKALTRKNLLSENPNLYAIIIDNLAYSKLKVNDQRGLPALFFESLAIREQNGASSGVIANKIHLSEYYAFMKDTATAKAFAHDALQLSKVTKVSGDLLASLKQLSIVEIQNSSQYSREYMAISDSLQEAERVARDKFARIAFETDEIAFQNDKLHEQNRALLYFFVGTIMIGALLFVIRTQRAKNRELLLKQSQQKANEDIYNLMINQQKEIEESRIREKKRIAQELHDGILGRLFGTRLNLDSLNRAIDPESVKKRIGYLSELKNIEQDIREISHDLSREKFVLVNNFLAILNDLLENQRGLTKATLEVHIDNDMAWDQVSNNGKINLYRIIQEGLQNINKYADASLISVQIRKLEGALRLTIKDDGKGFDPNGKKKGIGLQNMVSRAHEIEGTIDIKSKRGAGTLIIVVLPILNAKELIS